MPAASSSSQKYEPDNSRRTSHEDGLRTLLENTLEGTLYFDSSGAIRGANTAASRLLGLSEQEITAALSETLASTNGTPIPKILAEIKRHGSFRGETVFRRGDGTDFPVEIFGIGFAAGFPWKACISFHPVPVPAPAERSSQESGQQESDVAARDLDLLLETMPQGVLTHDEQGRVLKLNAAAERILGEDAAVLREHYARNAVSPTSHDKVCAVSRTDGAAELALAAGNKVRTGIFQIYNPRREEYRWISLTAIPLCRPGEANPYRVYNIFEDITERKRAEEALRENEGRVRVALEAIGAGTFDYYPDSEKMIWSDRTKSHFYMPSETQVDRDLFLKSVHPADREYVRREAISSLLPESGGRLAADFRTVSPEDGTERWISVHGRMLFDREIRPTRLIGTTLDITARKRLEEKLCQRAEEVYKTIDVAPVALLVAMDPECRDVSGNRAANDILETEQGANLSPGARAAMAQPWSILRNGVEIPVNEWPLLLAVRGTEVRGYELEAVGTSGKRTLLRADATPLRDANGRVRGAVVALQDITQIRQTTADLLRESEDRFRNAADSAPVMIWFSDSDKLLKFVNNETTSFTGLPPEKLLGDAWLEVIHPDDLERVRAACYDAADRRGRAQTEFRIRRADSEYRHVLGTCSPRYIGEQYAGQIATLIDITELRQRKEEDAARQKWESLGTLAGGIAHDFNNLLGGILSQTDLALVEFAGGPPEEQIKAIRELAIRGSEIVRQIMVYTGQNQDVFEQVNISKLIEDTEELLKVVVSKRVILQFRLDQAAPTVRANPGSIRQLLINLVTNASEAMAENSGIILIAASLMQIEPNSPGGEGMPPGEYLKLEVSDTGSGIPLEMQAKIFEPFFSTKSVGRGLGLPVVEGIVKRLGGSITVRSVPGTGTTFQILLPAAAEPSER